MATILKEPNIIRNSLSKKSYAWKPDFVLIKFIRLILQCKSILINTTLLHFHLIPVLMITGSKSWTRLIRVNLLNIPLQVSSHVYNFGDGWIINIFGYFHRKLLYIFYSRIMMVSVFIWTLWICLFAILCAYNVSCRVV